MSDKKWEVSHSSLGSWMHRNGRKVLCHSMACYPPSLERMGNGIPHQNLFFVGLVCLGFFFVLFRGVLVFWKKKKNQSNKLLLRKISMRLKTLPPRAVRRMSCWHPLLYTLVLSCTFFHSAASNSISWQATSLVPYFVWLRELNFLFCCLDFFYCTEAKSSSSVLLPLSKLKQLTNI